MKKIYKCFCPVGDTIQKVDIIEHEKQFWLVPYWIVSPDKKSLKPVRIVSLDGLPLTDNGQASPFRFVLNAQLPITVFDGIQPQSGHQFLIYENPKGIQYPNPDGLH